MTEPRLNQISSDVHLLAAPLRWFSELLKAVVFLVVFPLVIVGAVIYALFKGGPIIDADTWFLLKVVFCILSPLVTAIIYGCCAKGSIGKIIAKQGVVLIAMVVLMGFLIHSQVITFNIGEEAPSFRTAPMYPHIVVNGKVRMTCEGLQDLRWDTVRRNGDTTNIDAALAASSCAILLP